MSQVLQAGDHLEGPPPAEAPRIARARTRLTQEQLLAATADEPCVFIEAAPGSGKTTVAAQRFGLLRFTNLGDERAVVALSFTRAATRELRQRIIRAWGRSALTSPHRVITIDTMLWELLTFLLRAGHITWPGGRVDLEVMDTWKLHADHHWTTYEPYLKLDGRTVTPTVRFASQRKSRVDRAQFDAAIRAGTCTHDDVRSVLDAAIRDPQLRELLADRTAESVRALIVDEVFDANPLDLNLVNSAAQRGVAVTIIGDPWQALYRFRGAGPHLVPQLASERGFVTYPLTQSFRFISEQSQTLARNLRAKTPVVLPRRDGRPVDVVLARTWKELWEIGGDVLPLSFGSPDSVPAAAALLLLNHVTVITLDTAAVFRDEALTQLGIVDVDALIRLDPLLAEIIRSLRKPAGTNVAAKRIVDQCWDDLVTAIGTESPRRFPRRHGTHTARLAAIRAHLLDNTNRRFVPGLTVHQAKGREWPQVGMRITRADSIRLRNGLDETAEADRTLYVALTRGERLTVAV